MEAVLNCRPEDLEDYYALLGCDELSSTEQILNEYKIRALACHPDKHQGNPKAVAEFQKLQEAKEVLSNDTKRKNYDLWRRSGVAIPFHDWQALNDSVKTVRDVLLSCACDGNRYHDWTENSLQSMHWAVRNKKEPMLEAAKAETPITSNPEDLYCQQEAPGIVSSESMQSSSDYWHRRFRWTADSPSCLLQKFRNYDI
uniref:DnaJ homolog subfamily C member 12-like n=1 Tax=Hippocampus comes TaxID=109280 RepID=A0A3Q2XFW1_HIPCM